MPLKLYNKKRDFTKTPEPKGKINRALKNLFVIQKHAASHLHYDFRLELNGVLLSWAVPKGPCFDPSVRRLAMHVEDHPVNYGNFEGIIPKGEYGGGTVMLWDKGTWHSEDENASQAYHKGHMRFTIKGKKLKGRWSLIRLKKDDDKSWFLIKAKDKYSKPISEFDITVAAPNSVLSQRTLDEIAEASQYVWTREGQKKKMAKKKPAKPKISLIIPKNCPKTKMPTVISPQLATLVAEAPSSNDWLHELKFDGYRILAYKKGKSVWLMTRNNNDWTSAFKNVAQALEKLPYKNIILDGEVCLLDQESKTNFQMLQNSIVESDHREFIYYIFDIIYFENYNLMDLPLIERKKILEAIMHNLPSDVLRFSEYLIGSGAEIFQQTCQAGLEGIVSKATQSLYETKRSKSWLKVKCVKRQEFIVGGYSPPQRSRQYFGSLYLGYYNKDKKFIYCGNVGTGFNEKSLKHVYQLLQKCKTSKNPFNKNPPGVLSAIWTLPKIVVEVEFTEWTSDGSLRHPSFKGIRTDKKPTQITIEKEKTLPHVVNKPISIKKTTPEYKLTHPQKILYSEDNITKSDLAAYYEAIQDWVLPYLVKRPLTLVRCPQNYKKCFYQKHITHNASKGLHTIPIKDKNGIEPYPYLTDIVGLMALVQMGVLEIHPWGSRIPDVEYPDMITIDLDPAPDVKWQAVVETAFLIKKHLLEYRLKSFVKTTGGKGLHIVIPILPEYKWDVVKNFTHVFVQFLTLNNPDKYVSEMSKQKRKGKIFIDYLRNQRGATAIAAYSTRSRIHAPVATPLDWDELTYNSRDTFYTLRTLPKRIAKLSRDPWDDFFRVKQSLHLDD